ncbi:MAG TPA: hypothetical protein VFN67_07385, partial [Polyangiales bacterium]|nr:hypothetical protein [Polyangiales bacterium]
VFGTRNNEGHIGLAGVPCRLRLRYRSLRRAAGHPEFGAEVAREGSDVLGGAVRQATYETFRREAGAPTAAKKYERA